MKLLPFEPTEVKENLQIMGLQEIIDKADEEGRSLALGFNHVTRELFLISEVMEPEVEPPMVYDRAALEAMPWRDVKALVEENGLEYTTKKEAIDLLTLEVNDD